jgi:hypothetical protein
LFVDRHRALPEAPVLPQDRERLVRDEEVLVSSGIHSRRRAMDELGIENPDAEFQRWLEEEEMLPSAKKAKEQNPSPSAGEAS